MRLSFGFAFILSILIFSNLSPAIAEYDRTESGMKKRFSCLSAYVDIKGIKNFPSKQEIDSFIKNVTQLNFISDSSVTTATDTKKISPFQLQRLGLNKASVTTHKKAFVELLNYEGTNEEYCALKDTVEKEVRLAAELAAKKKAEDEARRAAELAAKKKAEEKARRAAELAAKKRAEDEARRAAELAAKKKADDVRVAREESKVLLPALKEFVRSPNSLDIIEVGALLERYQSGATKGWTPQTLLAYQALSQHVKKNESFSMFLVKKIEDYRLRTNDEIRSLRQEITEVEMVLKNFIAENLGSAKANAALKLAQDARNLIQDLDIRNALALKDRVDKWFATNGLEQKSKNEYKILRAGVTEIPPSSKQREVSSNALVSTSPVPSAKTQKVVSDNYVNGTNVEKAQKSVGQKSNQQTLLDDDGSQIENFQQVFLVPQALGINSLNELDGATICVIEPNDSELVKKLATSLSLSLLQKSGSFEDFLSGMCDVAIVDPNFVTDKDILLTYDVFNHKSEKLYPEVIVKSPQSTFDCKLFQQGNTKFSLAFCAGFVDFFLEMGGAEASDRQVFSSKAYTAAYKKIDEQCGYTQWYHGTYDDTFRMGGFDLKLLIMAYKADRSAANLRKMQNPPWGEPCQRMMQHHMEDIKKVLR